MPATASPIFAGTFETYWNDKEFLSYTPKVRDRVVEALNMGKAPAASGSPFPFDIRPYAFQQEILDKLEEERTLHGKFRNLIVDEFHHAEARTYRRLLEHYRPRILLGLTATPERMDGKDVIEYFDGWIAAKIRLHEAIDRRLLSHITRTMIGNAPHIL